MYKTHTYEASESNHFLLVYLPESKVGELKTVRHRTRKFLLPFRLLVLTENFYHWSLLFLSMQRPACTRKCLTRTSAGTKAI